MTLANAEVDAFNAALGELRAITDRDKAEAVLRGLTAQLRAYERRAQITSSLSAYDRRVTNIQLTKLAYNLAAARQLKVPRKAFAFSNRKYIKKDSAVETPSAPVIQYIDENVTCDIVDASFRLEPDKEGTDYTLRKCVNARIVLPTQLSTLYVDDCDGCMIFCSSVSGALHMERCRGLVVIASCHQLRIHHTASSTFVVAVGSSPIIEHSLDLQFAPLTRATIEAHTALLGKLDPEFNKHLLQSGLDPVLDETQCFTVRDFSWLKAGDNPHYKVRRDVASLEPENLFGNTVTALVEQ